MIEFSLNITEVDSDLPAHVGRWFVPGARALGSLWAGPPPGGVPARVRAALGFAGLAPHTSLGLNFPSSIRGLGHAIVVATGSSRMPLGKITLSVVPA